MIYINTHTTINIYPYTQQHTKFICMPYFLFFRTLLISEYKAFIVLLTIVEKRKVGQSIVLVQRPYLHSGDATVR